MPKYLIIELKHDTSSREERRLIRHIFGDVPSAEVIEQSWSRDHAVITPEFGDRVYKDYEDADDE